MLHQVIIYNNEFGTCTIVIPAPQALKSEYNPDGLTLEQIIEKDVPKGVEWQIIDSSSIPTDSSYRNAWFKSDVGLAIDLDKAKELHLAKIREAREIKFRELGFPYRLDNTLEESIIPVETRNKLQALRDIPQNINLDAVSTIEELKAIWPTELNN